MKTIKVIGNCCLVFLAILSVFLSLGYGYYHFFVHEKTTGVNYIDNQTPVNLVEKSDELTEEEIDYYENRYLFNVNYYSNNKENGIELQEMQLNYFTDPNLLVESCRSTGMQYIGDFETYTEYLDNEEEINNRVVPDFYYYDTTNMISWTGGKVATQLNRDAKLIIKIGEQPYRIQLTGKVDHYDKFLFWEYISSTTYYDYGDVFYDVFNAVESNSAGYGDYYITLDLSSYFTVEEYDSESGKWIEDNVTDDIFTYAVCKFHYDENGAVNSNQSLYNIIACNPSYDIDNSTTEVSYWQAGMNYILKENTLLNGKSIYNFRYSEVYKGYFISLTIDTKQLFADMPNSNINIYIDLDSEYLKENNINIVGIDYNGFEDFRINILRITGNSQTIYLLDSCLNNSKLQTLEYSNGITFDISDTAINSDYSEVVL